MNPRAILPLVLLFLSGTALSARAQDHGIYYPVPPPSSWRVTSGIRYGGSDSMLMDVYRPANVTYPVPVLLFHTMGAQRQNPIYAAWARIAASRGVVGVLADLGSRTFADDYRAAVGYLMGHGRELGVDTAAIVAMGSSGNGYNVFRAVQNEPDPRIKAVVVYYSGTDVTRLRRDLPVLYIRAGLDRPPVNAGIDSLVARALAQNAPITVVNFPAGHHGFDGTDDNAITRDLVDQTIEFVKRVTTTSYRAALTAGIGYAEAAAHVSMGDFAFAARAYAELVARSPDDAQLRLSYGEALLGDHQFAKACREFESLKGKGLGRRDLGLPAARACLNAGDPDLAMTWLNSIPRRFLPPTVKDDPAFAALGNRADFKALFETSEPPR